MKIQCQSCQAKYTIADEKVLGKVVKIRCKKCSSTIVINGNETQPAEDNADTHVFDYASQGAAGDQWTVNVADGDQRTMTPQEIVAEYKAGTVNDETYCWKDGMADWLPLREIDQLYGMIKLGPGPSLEDVPQSMPSPAHAGGMGGGAGAPLFGAGEVASAVDSPFAGHANGNGPANGGGLFGGGAVETAQAAPAAARRASARGAGQDLFGNVEKAGGEDDVMTSAASGGVAAAGGAAAAAGAEKMTGQRNENSVLFSLSALTSDTKKAPEKNDRTTATSDGSGLIDIRALSANMGSGDEKKDTNARVDDIMNLSGGGAFGAALAAPILAPPPLETADLAALAAGGAPPKQNKMMMFAILGAGAFIAIAIVLAVVLTRGPSAADAAKAAASASAAPDSTGATAMNDPAATATATPTATATGNEPPPPSVGNADKPATVNPGTKSTPTKTGGGGGGGGAVAAAEPAPKPAEPAKPASFGDALAAAAGKPKEQAAPSGGGGGSTAPFDRGAAAAALGGINVQSCKKPDGPTGSGRVEVTFNPDGSAASANIIEGPFPGTAVGGCVAGKFRGARVPAFSGAPVHVKKSFTIN